MDSYLCKRLSGLCSAYNIHVRRPQEDVPEYTVTPADASETLDGLMSAINAVGRVMGYPGPVAERLADGPGFRIPVTLMHSGLLFKWLEDHREFINAPRAATESGVFVRNYLRCRYQEQERYGDGVVNERLARIFRSTSVISENDGQGLVHKIALGSELEARRCEHWLRLKSNEDRRLLNLWSEEDRLVIPASMFRDQYGLLSWLAAHQKQIVQSRFHDGATLQDFGAAFRESLRARNVLSRLEEDWVGATLLAPVFRVSPEEVEPPDMPQSFPYYRIRVQDGERARQLSATINEEAERLSYLPLAFVLGGEGDLLLHQSMVDRAPDLWVHLKECGKDLAAVPQRYRWDEDWKLREVWKRNMADVKER